MKTFSNLADKTWCSALRDNFSLDNIAFIHPTSNYAPRELTKKECERVSKEFDGFWDRPFDEQAAAIWFSLGEIVNSAGFTLNEHVRRITHNREHALITIFAQRLLIRRHAHLRRIIELPVTRMHNDALIRAQRHRMHLGDGMRHRHQARRPRRPGTGRFVPVARRPWRPAHLRHPS